MQILIKMIKNDCDGGEIKCGKLRSGLESPQMHIFSNNKAV